MSNSSGQDKLELFRHSKPLIAGSCLPALLYEKYSSRPDRRRPARRAGSRSVSCLRAKDSKLKRQTSPATILSALESRDFDVVIMDLNYTRDTRRAKRDSTC